MCVLYYYIHINPSHSSALLQKYATSLEYRLRTNTYANLRGKGARIEQNAARSYSYHENQKIRKKGTRN